MVKKRWPTIGCPHLKKKKDLLKAKPFEGFTMSEVNVNLNNLYSFNKQTIILTTVFLKFVPWYIKTTYVRSIFVR